jgi:hypothetical protein
VSGTIVIEHGLVVPAPGEDALLDGGVVVIEGDRISRVGNDGDAGPPPDGPPGSTPPAAPSSRGWSAATPTRARSGGWATGWA